MRKLFAFALVLGGAAAVGGCPGPSNAPPRSRVAPPARAMQGPPAKVIYIARHGRTRMNRFSQIGGQLPGDGLDPLGFKQRVGLFLLLKDEPIKAIYTSQLLRARQTAEPLALGLGLAPVVTPDLNEFHGGVSEGICYSLLGKSPRTKEAAACDEPSKDPLVLRAEAFLKAENRRRVSVGIGYRWPGGGESLLDVEKRLKRFLAQIPTSLRDETILVMGHSGTNRFLLAQLMGWRLVDALRVRQGNTQVFRVERRPGQAPLLKVFTRGQWVACDAPATLRGGLPCLRPPKPAAPTPGGPSAPRAAPGAAGGSTED